MGLTKALVWVRAATVVALLVLGAFALPSYLDDIDGSSPQGTRSACGVVAALAFAGAGALITVLIRERRAP